MEITIRQLEMDDKPAMLALMATDDLRPEGIMEEGTAYWGAFEENRLIGMIGSEYEDQYCLLRSALVHSKYRSRGIAAHLADTLMQEAKKRNLEAVYLFSTDAGAYWMGLGFVKVETSELVEKLASVPQVKLFDRIGWLPTEISYRYILEY